MGKNGWKGNPVDAVMMPNGTIASIDNTRVLAARKVGIDIQANVRGFDEPIVGALRQRTLTVNGVVPETWGEAAILRINRPLQNQYFPGWSQRFQYGSIYDPIVK